VTNLSISLYILVRAADLDIGADSVFEPVDRFAGINRAERPLRRAFTIERERLVKGMSVAIEQVGQRVQIHTLVAKGELTAALFRSLQGFAPGQGHGFSKSGGAAPAATESLNTERWKGIHRQATTNYGFSFWSSSW